MSSPIAYASYMGLGLGIEVVRTTIQTGLNMESFYNGMLGALGALVVKVVYDIVKHLIKKRKDAKIE